jgi:hypothetical protein
LCDIRTIHPNNNLLINYLCDIRIIPIKKAKKGRFGGNEEEEEESDGDKGL